VSDLTPTRSAVIALADERRAMHDSYVFLDEKCLLLAQAMLKELRAYERASAALKEALAEAAGALQGALARHGLDGLQRYPAADPAGAALAVGRRALMGVRLQEASLGAASEPQLAPVNPSPEAEACRTAHARVMGLAAALAALWGNLERLYREYRRTVRRVRALQDVLLPEVDRSIYEIETSLEELERDEAVWLRHRPGP
jgi:V/A-type H+/Na+-transporting ATPase subunit D